MIRGGQASLGVRDVASAVRFYIETLGMKLVAERNGAAVIDAGDGFLFALEQGAAPAKTALTFFPKVPMSEAIAIFENRGVSFELDGGVARFADPDGNALCLAEPPR